MNFTGFCGKPPFFRPRGTAGKAQNGKPRQSRDCRGGVLQGRAKAEPVVAEEQGLRTVRPAIRKNGAGTVDTEGGEARYLAK